MAPATPSPADGIYTFEIIMPSTMAKRTQLYTEMLRGTQEARQSANPVRTVDLSGSREMVEAEIKLFRSIRPAEGEHLRRLPHHQGEHLPALLPVLLRCVGRAC